MFDRIGECGAPAAVRLEGYSPRDGLAHGSLDVVVYACTEHSEVARVEWLRGFLPYSTVGGNGQCGDRISFVREDATDASPAGAEPRPVVERELVADDSLDAELRPVVERVVQELMTADDPVYAAGEFARLFRQALARVVGQEPEVTR